MKRNYEIQIITKNLLIKKYIYIYINNQRRITTTNTHKAIVGFGVLSQHFPFYASWWETFPAGVQH